MKCLRYRWAGPGTEVTRVEQMETETLCEVAVIGGGNAALCAAITAAERGASVCVIEHAPYDLRGGNSRHTRNLRVMHESPESTLSGSYSEREYWEDLQRVTGGRTDEALARLTIRESAGLTTWMHERGARFQPSLRGTLSLSRTNAFFRGGGKALLNAYYHLAERLGVRVLYNTEVRALELKKGRVDRAVVAGGPAERTVRAGAWVVACGGFQANIGWLKEYWGEAAENFRIRGTPFAQGRILRNLLDQGAESVGDPTQCHAVAIDARAPRFDGGIVTRLDCVPFGIVVNRDGQRFYDEGEDLWPKRYAIWGRLVAALPGQIAYSIFDAKSVGLFMPSAFPAIQAQSWSELAAKLGLNAAALEDTVRRFNQAVRPGAFDNEALDDCATGGLDPPKSHWARALDTPPYSAFPLCPGITFTYLGLRVNERAQVQLSDGQGVSNLFAAGEIMAGNVLGMGYLAGLGMTIGTVFGRVAGRDAAAHARG